MDPLSIIASSIAVIQALTATGQGLNKILALWKAPVELQALFNEVETLRCELMLLQPVVHDASADSREALISLLQPVQSAVLDLNRLIHYRLTRADRFDADGQPKVSRSGWLKAGSEIERIRQHMRDARGNLQTGLLAQNLSVQRINGKVVSEVQSVVMTSNDELRVMRAEQTTHFGRVMNAITQHDQTPALKQSLDKIADRLESLTMEHARDAMIQSEVSESARQEAQPNQNIANLCPESFLVTTSISTGRCPRLCPCQCHVRRPVRTPSLLQGVVGQLIFDYTYLVQPQSCDFPPCQKQARRSNFTYFLPKWIASRAVVISGIGGDLSGIGASWSIKVPVVISKSEPIWYAVDAGNVGLLQQYFSQKRYSPYAVNKDGYSMLHFAVNNGQTSTYKFLLRQGCDPGLEDKQGRTPAAISLMRRTWHDLSLDPDDVADDLAFTTLHHAIVLPSSECRLTEETMRTHFRDVNARDRVGMSPLHWSCRKGDVRVTQLLLDWKADANLRDHMGRMPLHYACASGTEECVSLLLSAGVEVNGRDNIGQTALFKVVNSGISLIPVLPEHGTWTEHQNDNGFTPLHRVSQRGHVAIIKQLLECGADAAVLDMRGMSAIQLAVIYDQPYTLAALVKHCCMSQPQHSVPGDDLQTQPLAGTTHSGRSVLHSAALYAGVEVMETLARANLHGLDPLRRDKYGDTLDDYFYRYRHRNRTMVRPPFGEEEAAWCALMDSYRRQNGLLIELDDDYDESEDDRESSAGAQTSNEDPEDEASLSQNDDDSEAGS